MIRRKFLKRKENHVKYPINRHKHRSEAENAKILSYAYWNLVSNKRSFIPRCTTYNHSIVFMLQSQATEIVISTNEKQGLPINKRLAQQMCGVENDTVLLYLQYIGLITMQKVLGSESFTRWLVGASASASSGHNFCPIAFECNKVKQIL